MIKHAEIAGNFRLADYLIYSFVKFAKPKTWTDLAQDLFNRKRGGVQTSELLAILRRFGYNDASSKRAGHYKYFNPTTGDIQVWTHGESRIADAKFVQRVINIIRAYIEAHPEEDGNI